MKLASLVKPLWPPFGNGGGPPPPERAFPTRLKVVVTVLVGRVDRNRTTRKDR